MLTLATSNEAKYAPFACELERMRIRLAPPSQALPELQGVNFTEALAAKARAAATMFGEPVLVDDAGLVLEAYAPFPGPLTAPVLRSLGAAGLRRLLTGVTHRATLECHLGCWTDGALRSWTGTVTGQLDFSRTIRNERMILSDLFVAEPGDAEGELLHRARALAALETEVWELHLRSAPNTDPDPERCAPATTQTCPFCVELDDRASSLFAEIMSGRLATRVLYEDDDFVVMPPLGEFIEGGLLLLARRHVLSFAYLPPGTLERAEQLVRRIGSVLEERWGAAPLVFEHGPAPDRGKGVCCVDHAHLNIFPARVPIHPHLARRMHLPLARLSELRRFRVAEFGYLFVQENDGTRRVYDAQDVPTQLVRRIIATGLGFAERWHWQDYPGENELVATYEALRGRIRL